PRNRPNPRRRPPCNRRHNRLHRPRLRLSHRLSHSELTCACTRFGNFDRLQISVKWPMTLFNNYFSPPADNGKRFIDIGF
ncbi:hypothetical protein, partial [Burkholderia sp. Ac-20384]|uniref:hypothetical protein n=1 Tax=Burkholderia sp. Ac-20384 TaxID=2703902 RepID=UPI00198006BD